MTLTEDLKQKARQAAFVSIGISKPNTLHGLPHGWIGTVCNLRSSEEELPTVKSLILMSYYAWDESFNLAVDSTYLHGRNMYTPKVPLERYQLYYEVLKKKHGCLLTILPRKVMNPSFRLQSHLKQLR